ncbi:aldo/keto reductase [candidate division KSB1 bacterium]|nr:aldo/keto reductase [candidate division KSB1 bacterium]
MITKKLGWTDLDFTRIGLGTWAMGGPEWQFGWGPQDDKKSIKTIYKALDNGINWIDTAAVYGLGHSETIIGKALKGMGQKPIIASKCSRVWNEKKELGSNLKRDNIRKECESSLKRLQIETIDLYQIHWPRPEEDIEEGWGAVAELIREGKVRYGGVCNFNVRQLERILPIHPVASLQPPYSMLVRGIENEILPFCGENNIGVVAYSPMYKGLLTGKFTRERAENLPESDHRCRDPRFMEPELTLNLHLVEELEKIAGDNGKTVLQLAIAWVLRHPEMTSAIVGARKPEQLDDFFGAADWTLSGDDVNKVEMLLKEREEKLDKIKKE